VGHARSEDNNCDASNVACHAGGDVGKNERLRDLCLGGSAAGNAPKYVHTVHSECAMLTD